MATKTEYVSAAGLKEYSDLLNQHLEDTYQKKEESQPHILHVGPVISRLGSDGFWIVPGKKGYYSCDGTNTLFTTVCGMLSTEISNIISLSESALQTAINNAFVYRKNIFQMMSRGYDDCKIDFCVIPIEYSDDNLSSAFVVTATAEQHDASGNIAVISLQLQLPWDGPMKYRSFSKLMLRWDLASTVEEVKKIVDGIHNSESLSVVEESGESRVEVNLMTNDQVETLFNEAFGLTDE